MDKKHSNVMDMLKSVSEDTEFNKNVAKRIQERRLVKMLIAMRCKAGFSQAEIAQKIGCSQGKISKLENGDDDNISIGDLIKYCSAINIYPEISFFRMPQRITERITAKSFQLKLLLDELINMSQGDEQLGQAADQKVEAPLQIVPPFDCLESESEGAKRAIRRHISKESVPCC